MARSIKKGPYVDPKLLKKALKAQETGERRAIKTWSRRSMILPEFVGLNFAVHNGKEFGTVYVSENMVGHKFGEFVPTRNFRRHGLTTDRGISLK